MPAQRPIKANRLVAVVTPRTVEAEAYLDGRVRRFRSRAIELKSRGEISAENVTEREPPSLMLDMKFETPLLCSLSEMTVRREKVSVLACRRGIMALPTGEYVDVLTGEVVSPVFVPGLPPGLEEED